MIDLKREAELRQAIEQFYFAYRDFTARADFFGLATLDIAGDRRELGDSVVELQTVRERDIKDLILFLHHHAEREDVRTRVNGPPFDLLGLFRGVDQGSWNPNDNNFGLYTIVIGAQTLHATGYAMGVQRDGAVGTGDPTRDTAVVAHFGDGASSQGDVNEAFVFAASYNAPVVFFCQNNQWAISEPFERQSRIPLYRRAEGFGFPEGPAVGLSTPAASGSPEDAPESMAGRASSPAPTSFVPAVADSPYRRVLVAVDRKTCEILRADFQDAAGSVKLYEVEPDSLRRSGALAGLLMLPLAVPLLIFGAGLVERGNDTGALQLLGAVSLLLVAGVPFAAGAAIRAARD